MRLLRNLLLGFLLLGFISSAKAQLIKPVEGSGESVGTDAPAEQPKKRAPVLAAKWPFKFGKKLFGKQDAADPFLEGAVAQRQLATQLSARNGVAGSATAPQPPNSGNLASGSFYPWPAPVDSAPQVVIPAGASSNTTWQSAPIEANAAGQLPSGVSQSPASPAVARSTTATSPTAPGQRFSHFAASHAKNPPPAAVPIPTSRPPGPSAIAADSASSSTTASANVPAGALISDDRAAAMEMAPRFTPSRPSVPTNNPPTVVAATTQPTTLSAGPPTRPPSYQPPLGMPPNSSPAQTLTPPSTGLPMRTSPAPAGGQFAVENMDQDIWGPPLAKPSRPSATPSPSEAKPLVPRVAAANRDTAAAAVAAAAAPSSAPVALTPPVASAATARNVTSRDGDFEPTGSMMPPAGVAASRPSPAPPAYAGRSTAAPSAVVLPEQKLSSSGEPAAAPFGGDPQVALLDSAVLHESLEPSANALVHGTLDEGTRVLAIVGDQSILAGDVLGQINEMLAPYRSQASEMELADQREKIIQEMLPRLIERKLIFYDFLKQIPIDKLPEIEQEVYKHFNEKRLPEILEKTGLKSAAEFDAQLRSLGSSLANQQRLFFEQMVAAEAVQREARGNDEVSHDEMLSYYNEHLADFSFPAKVRWERLAVDPSRFPTPGQAYNVLARMGNEVFHGANFADVARRSSHGPKAAEGGQHHWTTQGSLVNKEIDRLLFMLPEGQLSKVVKSDSMYQILRVVERVEAGTKPFIAMQNEIVEKIKKQRFDKRVEAYLARLRDETYVWTSGGDAAPTQVAQPVAGELMR